MTKMIPSKKDIVDVLNFNLRGLEAIPSSWNKKFRDAKQLRIDVFKEVIEFVEDKYDDYMQGKE